MFGQLSVEFPDQSRPCDPNRAALLHKTSQVIQVQVVGPVIEKRVDADYRVEKPVAVRQRSGVGMDRKDPVRHAGVTHALEILRGAEPQVRGPHLHAKFAAQEDRRCCPPAPQIQHAHAGSQVERLMAPAGNVDRAFALAFVDVERRTCQMTGVERLGQPLGEPQRIGPAAHAGGHPVGVIRRRARESLGEKSLVHGRLGFKSLLRLHHRDPIDFALFVVGRPPPQCRNSTILVRTGDASGSIAACKTEPDALREKNGNRSILPIIGMMSWTF